MFSKKVIIKKIIKLAPDESNRIHIQLLGGTFASAAAFTTGSIIAWSSPASSRLFEEENPYTVDFPSFAWIVAITPLGAAIACIPASIAAKKIGRRRCLLAFVSLSILGWGFIIWGRSIKYLYVGRFICGACCGISSIATPFYLSEICQKEIKNMMDTLYQFSFTCGVLFVYTLSGIMHLSSLSGACLVMSLFVAALFFFPESPVFYLSRGNVEMARKSLRFYRGPKYDVERELNDLKGDIHQYTVRLTMSMYNNCEMSIFEGVKATFFSIGLMMFQQLSGINVFISYAEQIFSKVGSKLRPSNATIAFGIIQVVSTVGFSYILNNFGRRLLLAFSAAMMAFSCFLLAVYFLIHDIGYSLTYAQWVPLYSLSVYIIAYSLGYGPLAWALSEELLPDIQRGKRVKYMPFTTFFNWIFASVVIILYPNIKEQLGESGPFALFTVSSICATIFSLYLPENLSEVFFLKYNRNPNVSVAESSRRSTSSLVTRQLKTKGISLKPL